MPCNLHWVQSRLPPALPRCLPNSDPPFPTTDTSCLLTPAHPPQNSRYVRSEIWLGFPRGRFPPPPPSPADTPRSLQVRIPPVSARSPPPAGVTPHPAESRSPKGLHSAGGRQREGGERARGEDGGWTETGVQADRAQNEGPERASERAGGEPGPAGTGRAGRLGPGSAAWAESRRSDGGPRQRGVSEMRSRTGRGGKSGGAEDQECDPRRRYPGLSGGKPEVKLGVRTPKASRDWGPPGAKV